MPLDQRSALPTVPGVPAWGAVAVAAGLTFIGFALDAMSGSELTSTFSILYFLGCVLAVLAVRYRGLFTAVVQPPLLLFVAVPIGQQILTDGSGSLKDLALNVAYPLVNRFPLMLAATVVVALIAGARVFLAQQGKGAPARSKARRAPTRSARADSSAGRREASSRSSRAASRRDDHARRDEQTRRDDYETPMERRPRPRRAPVNEPRPPRPTHEPVTAHASGYGGRDSGGYREPIRRETRRETVYGEPIARDREPIQRDPIQRDPIQRDPIPVRSRPAMDIPPRPAPRVRYRERREPPIDG